MTCIINGEQKKAIASSKYNFNYQTTDNDLLKNNAIYYLTKLQKNGRQIEILEKALEVANSLKDIQAKHKLLIQIAEKYAELGKREKAVKLLNQSLETIKTVDNLEQKTELMLDLSQAYENIGKTTIGKTILKETISLVDNIEDELVKAQRLTEIALRQPQESADNLLAESTKLIAKASEPVPLFPFQPTPLNGRISFFGKIDSAINTTNEFNINLGLEQTWKYNEFAFRLGFTTNFDSGRILIKIEQK
ncbi:MAG: hypothetical protein QNJ42_14220 [Crocosphaera sp.]|nr:hypothetical protein [Crocosphaera sp.]